MDSMSLAREGEHISAKGKIWVWKAVQPPGSVAPTEADLVQGCACHVLFFSSWKPRWLDLTYFSCELDAQTTLLSEDPISTPPDLEFTRQGSKRCFPWSSLEHSWLPRLWLLHLEEFCATCPVSLLCLVPPLGSISGGLEDSPFLKRSSKKIDWHAWILNWLPGVCKPGEFAYMWKSQINGGVNVSEQFSHSEQNNKPNKFAR